MTKLLHPDLSYEVRGALFDVYNALGPMLKESFYQDAISVALDKRKIASELEKAFEVFYEGERVGLYYVDLWVEGGKLLLELKVAPAIAAIHKAQALSYLKVTDCDLAFVVNFGGSSLEVQRLPNFLRDKRAEFEWQEQGCDENLLYPGLVNTIQCACHRVHFELGPGFLHQVYRRATMIELRRNDIGYEYVKQLPVEYEGQLLGYQDVRLILVEGKVLLTVFALRETATVMSQQLKARLRRLGLKLGVLANFSSTKLEMVPVRTT
jgi:GxxExxY protein